MVLNAAKHAETWGHGGGKGMGGKDVPDHALSHHSSAVCHLLPAPS